MDFEYGTAAPSRRTTFINDLGLAIAIGCLITLGVAGGILLADHIDRTVLHPDEYPMFIDWEDAE
jgi:hypothetical protein